MIFNEYLEINKIWSLSKNDKYGVISKKVANLEELWSLYNDGWAMIYEDNGDKEYHFGQIKYLLKYVLKTLVWL